MLFSKMSVKDNPETSYDDLIRGVTDKQDENSMSDHLEQTKTTPLKFVRNVESSAEPGKLAIKIKIRN